MKVHNGQRNTWLSGPPRRVCTDTEDVTRVQFKIDVKAIRNTTEVVYLGLRFTKRGFE